LGKPSAIPEDPRWRTLFKKEGEILDGEALEAYYIQCLTTLGKEPGMIGIVFRKSQNRIQNTARLCVMNLYLHGIGLESAETPIHVEDSLAKKPGRSFSMVLSNPPFGKKSSITTLTDAGESRREFTGGERASTEKLWIYDLRTNMAFTLKNNTLARADLDDFVKVYHPENRHERTETWSPENPEGRWRAFTYDELAARDKANLDIFWLRDESLEDSANLPEPDVLAAEIIEDLEAALEQFRDVFEALGNTDQ
jgi:type I restriction-modification system DNA methylase subunit